MSIPPPQPSDIQAIIGKILATPLEEVADTPVYQDFYHFDGKQWAAVLEPTQLQGMKKPEVLKSFRLITWNIDVLSPGGPPRMAAALDHLQELVSKAPPGSEPIVIFLQEMSKKDVELIQETKWVQNKFYVTDLAGDQWTQPSFGPLYGTTTLIDKTLVVDHKPFRVQVPSRFQRDALFVDIRVRPDSKRVLRLCNTHLESLVAQPPVRPLQVTRAAAYLKDSNNYASVLAGDLNAIEPFDRTLHSENGLKDAYLELGGKEDADEGYTWGQQAPKALRDQFGCSRMDKAFYWGHMQAMAFERIGEGVEVRDEQERHSIRGAGGEIFASDHLGLSILFQLH
jgi:tyrosyl-DNA phosphodiesterase 2